MIHKNPTHLDIDKTFEKCKYRKKIENIVFALIIYIN